jgi:hypothetical protein
VPHGSADGKMSMSVCSLESHASALISHSRGDPSGVSRNRYEVFDETPYRRYDVVWQKGSGWTAFRGYEAGVMVEATFDAHS